MVDGASGLAARQVAAAPRERGCPPTETHRLVVTGDPPGEGWRSPSRSTIAYRVGPAAADCPPSVTATEASRSFAAILDEAERGHSVVVTRGGRRIATIGPAGAGNGAAVLALLEARPRDEHFAAEVLAVREAAVLAGPAWPAD